MNKKPFALLVTDSHLDSFNTELINKFYLQAIDICKKKKIENLIMMGDFFESRQALSIEVLLAANQVFSYLNESKLNLFFISGNHDQSRSDKPSYFSVFKPYFKNIEFYEELKIKELSDLKLSLTFLPYKEKEFEQFYKEISDYFKVKVEDWKYVLFGHQEANKIPIEIQIKYDKVFLGHIHDKENISDRTMYIGSAFQQNFSEDTNKGFTILYDDLSTSQIKFEFKEYVIQHIDLNVFDENQSKEFILKFKKDYPNKFLRVILEGFNKEVTDLKIFCKQNNVDCLSNIQNMLDGEVYSEEISFKSLSDEKIKNYFDEFIEKETINQEVKDLLYNYINK